jgi:hypothetical protein
MENDILGYNLQKMVSLQLSMLCPIRL